MILETKLRYKMKSDYVDRRRVRNWLDGQTKKHPVQLFYGCCGMGKTSTVAEYVRGNFHERYGYYQLDRSDDEVNAFRSYFAAMIRHAGYSVGYRDVSSEAGQTQIVDTADLSSGADRSEKDSLTQQIFHFLTWCEEQKKPYALVFDGIQWITEEEILEALRLLMMYAGDSCVLFFVAEGQISDFWKQQVAEGLLFAADIRKIIWKESELASYFRTGRITVSTRLRNSLMKRTGGCPGLLEIERRYFEEAAGEKLEEMHPPYVEIDEYLNRNVWKYMSESQHQLLRASYVFPYIDGSFCQSVLEISGAESELMWLRIQGLMIYDRMRHMYTLPDVLRGYLGRTHRDLLFYRKDIFLAAAKWYEENNRYRAGYLVLVTLGDARHMADYMCHYVKELFFILDRKQMARALLHISQEDKNRPEILFFEGAVAAYDGNLNEIDRVEQAIFAHIINRNDTEDAADTWHTVNEERTAGRSRLASHAIKELYLNLCYMDCRTSIGEWMDLAERVLDEGERIMVYSITGRGFSLCFGYKNLTEFFLHGIKTQRDYRRRWERIFCEEQHGCFKLAEAEYFLETNREKEAFDRIIAVHTLSNQRMESNQQFCVFAMLCRLYRMDIGRNVYDSQEADIMQEIRSRYDPFHFVGAMAYRDYYTGYHADRAYIRSWLLYQEEQNTVKIRHENADIYLMKARIHLASHESSSALNILEMLEEIYRRENNTYRYTECIFAQAVAIYDQGVKSQALKLATKALTMGIRYHYVNLYCNYGKTGYELIVMYQDMIAGGVQKSKRKKKYFYGNIIRATYEEYEDILLRAARKAARQAGSADMTDVSAVNPQHLTAMELTVLSRVGDGLSNQDIAEELNIKLTTVKTHLSSIYRKLDVKNRQAAVREAQKREMM